MKNPFARFRHSPPRTRRRYDLPLNKGAGSGFLRLLIALMSVLALLSMAAAFVLSEMNARWTSGLENKVSVEVPAEDLEGKLLDRATIQAMTDKIETALKAHPNISDARQMSDQEISELVSPWLGDNITLEGIPVPGIVSVTFQKGAVVDIAALSERIRNIAPVARIDTHESWLADVLRFTGALRFAAFFLMATVGMTTAVAIAGAVKSKMAIHKEELELLHLMGASDSYITKQFQLHTMILALQGGLAGTILGTMILLFIGWFSGQMGMAVLPGFSLDLLHKAILAATPVFMGLIAALTARQTVLRALAGMP